MTRFVKTLLIVLCLAGCLSPDAEMTSGVDQTSLRHDYEGFTIWIDCARRGAVKFRYNVQRDQGDFDRLSTFHQDPDVPEHCQQTSTASYKHDDPKYHRGHLVPANHLDNSETAIRQSNFMTNILPQTQTLNLGAWKRTETITECYRDIDELLIIGGVIWGDDVTNDHFTESHGVATPEAYWKLILRSGDRVIAWIVPNTAEARSANLDQYLVTVEELERQTREAFPEVPEFAKVEKPETSWIVPIGCDRS